MVYIELSMDAGKPLRWGMQQSYCRSDGPIVSFVRTLVDQIDPSKKLVIPACDGLANMDPSEGLTKRPTWRIDLAFPSSERDELEHLQPDILGALCTRNLQNSRIVYLPLDDDTFVYGLRGIPHIPWEEKKPIVFWRGGTSGMPFVREQFVSRAKGNPHCDIRFVDHYGSRDVDSSLFASPVGFETFVRHKYIVVIDGAVISSSHQWVFGSGSVPIFVTHPLNQFWFSSHLKPWVNYVPVSYSLTEFEATIRWLIEHDAEARQIAQNALQLAQTIFTPSYQQDYLTREVERVLAPSIRCSSYPVAGESNLGAPQETPAPQATIRA